MFIHEIVGFTSALLFGTLGDPFSASDTSFPLHFLCINSGCKFFLFTQRESAGIHCIKALSYSVSLSNVSSQLFLFSIVPVNTLPSSLAPFKISSLKVNVTPMMNKLLLMTSLRSLPSRLSVYSALRRLCSKPRCVRESRSNGFSK